MPFSANFLRKVTEEQNLQLFAFILKSVLSTAHRELFSGTYPDRAYALAQLFQVAGV